PRPRRNLCAMVVGKSTDQSVKFVEAGIMRQVRIVDRGSGEVIERNVEQVKRLSKRLSKCRGRAHLAMWRPSITSSRYANQSLPLPSGVVARALGNRLRQRF